MTARRVLFCVRAEGAVRRIRLCRGTSTRGRSRITSRLATSRIRSTILSGVQARRRGTRCWCAAGDTSPRRAATGTSRSRRIGAREDEVCDELIERARGVGRRADCRSAARRVSLRRCRFQRGRRDDGRLSTSRSTPARSRSAIRRSTSRRTRNRWPPFATSHHVEQVDPDDFGLVDKLVVCMTSPMPTAPRCRPIGCASLPAAGDGGALGRRRRRELRRLSALSLALLRGASSSTAARGRSRPGVRAARAGLSESRTGRRRYFARSRPCRRCARDSSAATCTAYRFCPDCAARCSAMVSRDLQGYRAREVFARTPQRADATIRFRWCSTSTSRPILPGDILTKVDRASMAHRWRSACRCSITSSSSGYRGSTAA